MSEKVTWYELAHPGSLKVFQEIKIHPGSIRFKSLYFLHYKIKKENLFRRSACFTWGPTEYDCYQSYSPEMRLISVRYYIDALDNGRCECKEDALAKEHIKNHLTPEESKVYHSAMALNRIKGPPSETYLLEWIHR